MRPVAWERPTDETRLWGMSAPSSQFVGSPNKVVIPCVPPHPPPPIFLNKKDTVPEL